MSEQSQDFDKQISERNYESEERYNDWQNWRNN